MAESTQEQINYFYRGCAARGTIINHTIDLELGLEEYIAHHICANDEKRLDTLQMLLSTEKVTFGSKTDTFIQILKKKSASKKEFEKEFPAITSDLQNIAKIRNRFAHDIMPTDKPEGEPNDPGDYEICLRRGSTNELTFYTNDGIKELIDKIDKYKIVLFYVLIKEINGKPLISR